MAQRLRVGKGRASMDVRGASADDLRRQVESMMGPALELLEVEVEAYKTTEIDPKWPRATGRSADAWGLSIRVEPTRVGVSLVNDSGYAQYVRSARYGRQLRRGSYRNAFSEARRGFTMMLRDLRPRLRDELAKHLGGLARG